MLNSTEHEVELLIKTQMLKNIVFSQMLYSSFIYMINSMLSWVARKKKLITLEPGLVVDSENHIPLNIKYSFGKNCFRTA